MKRPWFSLGLLLFLCAFASYTGMIYVFIPFFILIFLVLPDKRLFFFLPLLFLRIHCIGEVRPHEVEGSFFLEPLSPLKEQVGINFQGEQYYVGFCTLEPGIYQGKLYLDEFSSKRSPTGFCERDYYHSRGFRGKAVLKEVELLERKTSQLFYLRERLYERTKVFGQHQGLVYSLLFGLKEGLEESDKELYAKLGLMHLFVVSGLHLGIYSRAMAALVKRLRGPRVLGDVLGFVVILFLTYLSGYHVSTLRSLGIFLLGRVAFYRKEKLDFLEAMGMVSFLLLLYRPSYATSFSFLLGSFAYGILRSAKGKGLLWMYLLMLPLQLVFLPQIKLSFYLLNSVLAFLMVGILPLLIVGFFLAPLASVLVFLLDGVRASMLFVERIPFAWTLSSLGWVSLLVFYGMLLLMELVREDQALFFFLKDKKVKTVFLILLLLLHGLEGDYRRKGVHFFDVGQGDSSLIVTEKGRTILIDTGKSKQIHSLLHHLGIHKLDLLILSHLDDDHSGQNEQLRYDKLYYPKGSQVIGGYPLSRGDMLQIDEVKLRVVSPQTPVGDSNEDSLMFYVEAYDHVFLYTGDVSAKVLETVEAEYCDLLKYPHHGSRYSLSSTFIDRLSPKMILLSYGRNRYGHPHQEVLDYGESRDVILFKTFEEGCLQIKKKGFRSY